MKLTSMLSCPLALGLVFGLVFPAIAQQEIGIEPPGEGEFIVDFAALIQPEDRDAIQQAAAGVLSEKAIPIIVVTVESMAKYGGGNMRIETFALLLYNQWGIGHEQLGREYWNKGILLLISRDDRMARIELGAGWDREADVAARQIMDEQIIPRFKQGRFSQGILAGVEALGNMARGEKLPAKPISWTGVALLAGAVGLLVFTFVSLIRNGASGWAWVLWAAVFGLLGYVLYNSLKSSAGSGGFSGGSFGGGFSGGGGATGSW